MAPTHQTELLGITEIAKNTIEVRLTRPDGFSFKAGQYVSLVLAEVKTGKITDEFHEFSIASSPEETELVICTRKSSSPFKSALVKTKPGKKIEIQGPFGNFVLPDSHKVQLIAGGVGITPFRSMIFSRHNSKISLWYFNKLPQSVAYLEQLNSRVGDGFVLYEKFQSLDRNSLKNVQTDQPVMVAGPVGFVKTARKILLEIGVQPSLIISEEFSGYK